MQFTVVQKFPAAAPRVIDAYRSEATWKSFANLPFVGTPSVAGFIDDEPVRIEASYRVSLELPAVARPFIDPRRLTFIEVNELAHDGSGSFHIVPDHYGELIRSEGTTTVEAIRGGRCQRVVSGLVEVSLGWQGAMWESTVERAIIGGLEQALLAQASQVPDV